MEKLKDADFLKFKDLIYNKLGIIMADNKKDMLGFRLDKLMKREGLTSYKEYYELLLNTKNMIQWGTFVDEITVHKTDFFREIQHFDFLKKNFNLILKLNKRITATKEIKIWSAACSTGEEPYTIAMVMNQVLATTDIKLRILATDASSASIKTAIKGEYPSSIGRIMQKNVLDRYFTRVGNKYKVRGFLKDMITFRNFNLNQPFPFKNTLDIIFCRNVMIYFDSKVQTELVKKFYHINTDGGFLFTGHSESLTGKHYLYNYYKPAIYLKGKC